MASEERGEGNSNIILIVILVLLLAGIFSFASSSSSFLPTGLLSLKLNLNRNIGDEYRVITKESWDGLADGVIYADGKTTYSQALVFRDPATTDPIEACRVVFAKNNDGETGNFLHCKKGDDIFEYRVSFASGLRSTIDDNNQLKEVVEENLMLLGQEFTVTRADVLGTGLKLRLSGGAVKKTIEEGKSETLLFDGVPYRVTVVMVSNEASPRAIININGQSSKPLEARTFITLNNGVPLFLQDVLTNEAGEGGVRDHVILVLGGSRSITLYDSDFTDDAFTSGNVVVNSEELPNTKVKIRAVKNNDQLTIYSLTYRLRAADAGSGDVFVPPGQGLATNLRSPLGLLSSVWDIRFEGMDTGVGIARPVGAIIKFDASGDGYRLHFTNNAGLSYVIPLLAVRSGTLAYGSDDQDLIFTEGADASSYNIDENDYFIVTSRSDDGKGVTNVLQFEGISGGNAVFTDQAAGTKSVPLFPTGAFASLFNDLDDFLPLNKIEVPLETLTGFQTAEEVPAEPAAPAASEPVSEPSVLEPTQVAKPSPPAAQEPSAEPVPEPVASPPSPVPAPEPSSATAPAAPVGRRGYFGGTPEENAARRQQIEEKIRREQFKQQCAQNLRKLETELGNAVGEIGVTERDGKLFIKLWGATEAPICSEFFNFLVVEKAFPFSPAAIQAEIAQCRKSVTIPPALQQCPNYQQMLEAVNRMCNELGEKLEEINSMQQQILEYYQNKCLPQLEQEIDDYNRRKGLGKYALSGPASSSAPGTLPSTPPSIPSTPPSASPSTQPSAGSPPSSPVSPAPDTAASPDDEFICCEPCPSTKFLRYYIPFAGNDCEPQDVRRDDLSPEQCVTPFVDETPTPEAVENAPKTYGPKCPTPSDIKQKDKQKKCDAAKQNYLALKAVYEALVPPVRAAWAAYQQSSYKDAAAKARYDDAYRKAHDAYFGKMIPAREEAKRLCDGVVPPTPAPPQKQDAPTQPQPPSSGTGTGTGAGTGTGVGTGSGPATGGTSGPSTPPPTPPSPPSTPPSAPPSTPPLTPPSTPPTSPLSPPSSPPSTPPQTPLPKIPPSPPLIPLPEPTAKDHCIEECGLRADAMRKRCMEMGSDSRDDCLREAGLKTALCFAQCKNIGRPSVPWEEGQREVQNCKDDCDNRIERDRQDCIERKRKLGEDPAVCDTPVNRDRQACYQVCEAERPPISITPEIPVGQPPITIPPAIPAGQAPPPQSPAPESITPKNDNFKNAISTPLHEMNEDQLKKVSDLKLGIPDTGSVKFLEDIDARGIDFDAAVKISPESVTVDVTAVPELNKPAILTIENLNLKNPALLADGAVCRQCREVKYVDGTLTFTVDHFTTFTAVESGARKGTLMVGGQSYTFFVNTDNDKIVVDQNADGTLDSSSVDIHVAGNGVLELGSAGSSVDVVLRTPRRYLENITEDETTTIRIALSGSAAGITLPNLNTTYHKAAKTQEGMTKYGAWFVLESKDTRNDLTITYPRSQRLAAVGVLIR